MGAFLSHKEFSYKVVIKIGFLMDDKILFDILTHFIYKSLAHMPMMATCRSIWHKKCQSLSCAIVNHILYKVLQRSTTDYHIDDIPYNQCNFSIFLKSQSGYIAYHQIKRVTVHFNLSTDDKISCNQGRRSMHPTQDV